MSQEEWRDITHTGPATLAGRYLRLFWQPVYRSRELPVGRAVPIRILSEDLTLYRGASGRVYLLDSDCAHRGTQLSVGWVEGENVRCRYHGWTYDGTGQCVEQPLEPNPFCDRIRVRSFPTRDAHGLIFAYFGEGEAPPMKRLPDLERPGYLEAGPLEYWPCNFMTRIDNDSRHVVFTHRESWIRMGGGPREARGAPLYADETEYGVRTYGPQPPGQPQRYTYFHMPNINQVRSPRIEGTIDDARNIEADRFFWRVPVDDEHCVNFVVDYIPLTPEEADAYRVRRETAGEASPAELNALGEQILAGKLRIEDLPPDMSIYKLFWIEDYVTQIGQRQTTRSRPEHLGVTDVGVALKRQIWQRELRALHEGRPLKDWVSPAGLAETQEKRHSVAAV